jgi:hypothetical protein
VHVQKEVLSWVTGDVTSKLHTNSRERDAWAWMCVRFAAPPRQVHSAGSSRGPLRARIGDGPKEQDPDRRKNGYFPTKIFSFPRRQVCIVRAWTIMSKRMLCLSIGRLWRSAHQSAWSVWLAVSFLTRSQPVYASLGIPYNCCYNFSRWEYVLAFLFFWTSSMTPFTLCRLVAMWKQWNQKLSAVAIFNMQSLLPEHIVEANTMTHQCVLYFLSVSSRGAQ